MQNHKAEPAPRLSVILPLLRPQVALDTLLEEIDRALAPRDEPYEVLAVGNENAASVAAPSRPTTSRAQLRWLPMPSARNLSSDLYMGLRASRGEIIVTLDAEGQSDPADLPHLLLLLETADMVVGNRQGKQHSRLGGLVTGPLESLRGRLLRQDVQDPSCPLKIFRRQVLSSILPLLSLHSLMPALAQASGFRVSQAPVQCRRPEGWQRGGSLEARGRPLFDLLGAWWLSHRSISRRQTTAPAAASETLRDVRRSSSSQSTGTRPSDLLHLGRG